MNSQWKRGKLRLVRIVALLSAPACAPPVTQLPPNIPNGGRAVAVAVHPSDANKIVVASETGGLFRSIDAGVHWAQVSASTTFGYTDVLYLPTDPSVVIATAQEDMRVPSGGGIWRSTDGGATWSKATITPPTADCTAHLAAFALAFEAASSRVWAGTLCGLASSTDGGATWTYLPTAPGYSNDQVLAVLAPAANQLKILTFSGVKVSSDGGAHWTVSSTGLPANIGFGPHNQIGVSPLDQAHLYWAFSYWFWNSGTSAWEGKHALYRSTNNGTSWSSVVDVAGINRPPFVKVAASSLSGGAGTYDVYLSDGGCTFQRATVTHSATPTFSAWTSLSVDHCDPADLGFGTDRRTPVLLASDGGLHRTADNGLHWAFAGAGDKGYWALQITEVTGQLHSGTSADLYFGTQDNDLWASPDLGTTWTNHPCCEGFFINVWRDPLPAAQTKVTGVWCGACGNFITGPQFAGAGGFPNPPNDAGNPRLLRPAAYIQNTALSGLTASVFDLTENTGVTWTPRYGFPEAVRDLSHVAQSASDPIVFTAVKKPGATPDGQEVLGIKRITAVLGSGTPVVSDVTGFGSFGIFPTMFAWYKPFGVDPADPNHFIVPDIIDNVVKASRDGGLTWQPDTMLTRLVTEAGGLRFRSGPFTQVSTIAFDPSCANHVLVGTVQAGVFQTVNNGGTWEKIAGSEVIPNVSSFFFPGAGAVVASSYGRGLWRIAYTCPPRIRIPIPHLQLAEPLIYWKGAYIPISQIHNPDACPVCTFLLAVQGRILDYVINPASGRVEQVVLSGGRIQGFSWDRTEVALSLKTATGGQLGGFGGDRRLLDLLSDGRIQVKGLLLESGALRGVILASEDVNVNQIPPKQPAAPEIRVDLPPTGGAPIGRLGRIAIRGSGFEPNAPVEIRLDGAVLQLEKPVGTDSRGGFAVSIPPVGIGGHTILARQRTSHGVLQDAYTFNVTVQDVR